MMHNPEMTFVKTSVKELEELGRIIAHKLKRPRGETKVMIPLKGFSYPNFKGRVFYNPAGVRAFAKRLKKEIDRSIPVIELPYHINDEGFALEVVREFKGMMDRDRQKKPGRR